MASCKHATPQWQLADCNEDGWQCSDCGARLGFRPDFDRDLVVDKVDAILFWMNEHDLLHVSNATEGVQPWKLVYEKRGKTVGRRHSAKPDDFYALVERALPGPYVEMFARKRRPGWVQFGDQLEAA